jgi:hypothetical protein
MSKLGVTPWDIVRVAPFEQGGLVDANTALNSDAPIQTYVGDDGDLLTAKRMKNTEGQKTFLKEFLPSLYTGGMRKLMQVSHLRGESGLSSARHDLFLPNWSDTYGIFVSSPVDGFCERWVIRICSSGIYRYPIRFSQPLPENWQADETAALSLTAAEAAQTVGRRWSAGNFDPSQGVQIGDIPLMYSDGNGGMYGTCGWAFDSDGHHAVNVGVRVDPDDPFAARKLSSLYVVTITEGAGGVPESASCVLQESGELVNHFDDTDPLKGPAIIQVADGLLGQRGYCKTYPCYPGAIGPRVFSTNTPVFAYYDPSDALHVVRFTPSWDTSSSSSSSSMEDARGSVQSFPDMFEGDHTYTTAFYGALSAVGYPSSVLGSSFGSDSHTNMRTMRFTSPLVTPTGLSLTGGREDGSFEGWGASFYVNGADHSFPFMSIDWSVTATNLTTGDSSTFGFFREATQDTSATAQVQVQGVITRTRAYAQEKHNHQVLILHGYDRTSYAIYSRQNTVETGITVSFGSTNMSIPDPATLQYNGLYSSGWVDHKIPSYHSEFDSPPNHIVRTCIGVSKIPSGMLMYKPSGAATISPPANTSEADLNQTVYTGKVVTGGTAHDVNFDSDTVESVFVGDSFFYKAGGSFRADRGFYQEKENMTPANVFGVGSYGETSGNVTAFVGWF